MILAFRRTGAAASTVLDLCRSPLAQNLSLFFAPLALTILRYRDFAEIDTGILWFHDDDFALDAVQAGISVDSLFPRGWYAVTPLLLLIYHAMHEAFGRYWFPYGAGVIVSHALMCSAAGMTLRRCCKSFVLSLNLTVLLALAFAFRPTDQFVNFIVHVTIVCSICVVIFVNGHLATGSGVTLAGSLAVMMAAAFLSARGPFIFVVVVLFLAVFLLLEKRTQAGAAQGTLSTRARHVAVATCAAAACYLLTAAYVHLARGNTWPWLVQHGKAEGTPFFTRFADTVSYGVVALFPFRDFAIVPPFVEQHGMALFLVTVAAFATGLGLLVRKWRRIGIERLEMFAVGCTWFVLALLYGGFAVAARQFMPLSHMRYGAYGAVFSLLALTHWIGGCAHGPGYVKRLSLSGVTVLTAWLALTNVRAVNDWKRENPRELGIEFETRGVDPPPGWVGSTSTRSVGYSAPRAVRVRSERATPVPSGIETTVRYDTVRFGSAYHVDRDEPSTLVVRAPGLYYLAGHVSFSERNRGRRRASIVLNGSKEIGHSEAMACEKSETSLTVDALRELAVGDAIELRVFQDSGEPLVVEGGTNYGAEFSAARVAVARDGRQAPRSPAATGFRPRVEAVRVARNDRQPIPAEEWVTLKFDEGRFDSVNAHDVRARSSRLEARSSGLFIIAGRVPYASNARGDRHALLMVNGEEVIAWQSTRASQQGPTTLVVSALWRMSVGDFVELRVLHHSDRPLAARSETGSKAEFMMIRAEEAGAILGNVAGFVGAKFFRLP